VLTQDDVSVTCYFSERVVSVGGGGNPKRLWYATAEGMVVEFAAGCSRLTPPLRGLSITPCGTMYNALVYGDAQVWIGRHRCVIAD
jgi:hypothetical protein